MRELPLCALLLAIGCGPTMATSPAVAPPSATPAPAPAVPPTPAVDNRSLFERLGGKGAIVAVVDEFVARVAADQRINQRFFNTDIPRLKGLLVEFVTAATGGEGKYTGRDMKSTHAGMDLVDEEFGALVENLQGALVKFKVGTREQNELLGALGPLKGQIVTPSTNLKPLDAAKLAEAEKLAATVKAPGAADLLAMAVIAGRRGQRSYAEQLFTRAELIAGGEALASIAATFREGAPPRVTTAVKAATVTTPQPKTAVGNSDEDEPVKKPARGSLKGVLHVDGKSLAGLGVVMLEPASGKWKKRAPKQRVIEQRDRQFAPRIMAVPVGSTVSFPNFDPVYHNVFSLSERKPFDLGIYRNGDAREVTFDKEGVILLGCNLHSNMSAHLVVVAAPHYAVVDANGGFFFRSLAPGKYRMKAWTDRGAEPTISRIEIKAGPNQTVVDLKGDAPPSLNVDKFGAPRGDAPPAQP